MIFEEKFKQQLTSLSPFNQQNNLFVLGVSGGVDSMVLASLLLQNNVKFIMAHCNFNLRGEESNNDEKFIIEFAKEKDVELLTKKFDTNIYATENKVSIQVAARDLRYEWFKLIQESHRQINSKVYLLTAHHLNDNIETVLFNFCRGTGINGITGIDLFDEKRNIIRPLLTFKKEEILAYAHEKNIKFVEDSSNISTKYSRNYFRHKIIPTIKEVFEDVEQNIALNINRFNEVAFIYNQFIIEQKNKLITYKNEEAHIPILKLLKTNPLKTIVWEIIKDYGFTSHQVDEVIKLCDAHNAASINNTESSIIKNRAWLIITKNKTAENSIFVISDVAQPIEFTNGQLKIKKATINSTDFSTNTNQKIALVDADKITFPLILRICKTGDYFYPLGMTKKKKLNRFFIDLKLSPIQKKEVWVVEMDKTIIWVVGLRLDNRFKIEENTKNVLEINFKPNI